MNNVIRKVSVVSTTCVIAIAGLAGCSTTGQHIDNGAELAKISSSAANTVVFGKFRLVSNGQDEAEGLFGSSARLKIVGEGQGQEIVGRVGRDGEFAWVLGPGEYSVRGLSVGSAVSRSCTGVTAILASAWKRR